MPPRPRRRASRSTAAPVAAAAWAAASRWTAARARRPARRSAARVCGAPRPRRTRRPRASTCTASSRPSSVGEIRGGGDLRDRVEADGATPDAAARASPVRPRRSGSRHRAHQEPVELRSGKRVRALVLDRVLGRDHEERTGAERARHGDLALLHRLEQRRLGLRRGAVDLVGQQQIGEHRSRPEHEVRVLAGYSDPVRSEGSRSGVNCTRRKSSPSVHGDGAGEQRLGDPRGALQQDVTAAGEEHFRTPSTTASWPTTTRATALRTALASSFIAPPCSWTLFSQASAEARLDRCSLVDTPDELSTAGRAYE